ncbi:proline-rich transmembrane protein 1-like [Sardina pilchardus]|uniref:proline-rich transmembrane protein 1-like n=1 Tax=Sardina pilchardus TaxID=27697 RepID=UPI002E0E5C29
MDPSQASAPPLDWNYDDRVGMAQPPPPYEDHLQYPTPGAYPPPGAVHPQGAYYPPGPWGPPARVHMGQPYPQAQYPQGQHPQGQYSQGQHPQGQYPQGQYPQDQYTQENTVMVHPTTVLVTNSPLSPIPDYMGCAIFNMCCCLPIGIAALIFSISTRVANSQGNRPLAEKNSQKTRRLNHAGLTVGLFSNIILIFLFIFGRMLL